MKDILGNLLSKKKNMVGLDIGSSYVKCMEVDGRDLSNLKLVGYAMEPIPKQFLGENDKFENMEEVADIIQKCWKKSGASTKNVVVSLPSHATIYKKVLLPFVNSEDELMEQVENELVQFLPNGTSLEEMAIDFYNLGPSKNNENENEILIVASKQDALQERIDLVEAAGLVPVVLDVEYFAIQNLIRFMKGKDFDKGVYVVVDASAYNLNFLVFKNGELIYTKDNQVGGFSLTQDVANNFDASMEEAEKIKINRTGEETLELLEKNFVNNISEVIASMLSYFISATSINNINEIIIIGGVAGSKGIEEGIKSALFEIQDLELEFEPYIATPLEDLEKGSSLGLNKISRDQSALGVVFALAFRKYLRAY